MLSFAKGPLFAAAISFMILGLLRLIILQSAQIRGSVKRLVHRDFAFQKEFRAMAKWLMPVGNIYRSRPAMTAASVLFHVGLLIVPAFLLNHIDLWRRGLGLSWPGIPMMAADVLTLAALAAGIVLLGLRVFDAGVRGLSAPMDFLVLAVLLLCFGSGYMAMHPAVNPASYNAMLLTHILSAEAIMIMIPATKLAHCVLFPFLRLSSEVFWRMPPGAGESIARELHGEDARV